MLKYILCLAGLLLLGCGQDRAAAPEPASAPAVYEAQTLSEAEDEDDESERILSHCLSILDQLPCSVDLDGDGTMEKLDLVTYTEEDGYPRWAIVLTAGEEEKRFETEIPCDMPHDLWVGDLDEDGAYEIFFHGDMASDDYLIFGFRHDLAPLLFEPDERAARWGGDQIDSVFAGAIEGFEDGHIVIEGAVDMLGTHWGVRNYALGDDGIIGPVSTVWTFDEEVEADRPLTVARELTAYKASVRRDPGEAFLLESGEKIIPLASDGCSRLWFATEKGKNGVLLLTPDEDASWLIDGVPEADCFADLPYSG